MAYVRNTWVENSAPAISAANLNNMEVGIVNAVDRTDMTTKGDLLVATASGAYARLAVGANDTVPVAASGQTTGVIWQQIGNAQVAAGAAIAYSKLNLANSIVSGDIVDGTIVNGDINASAAIAVSKLAAGSNGQVLTTTAGAAAWGAATSIVAPTHMGWSSMGANVNPTANLAYLLPLFGVVTTMTFTRFLFSIATQSGNMDLGLYHSDDESTFTRDFSTGSFTVPAASESVTKTVATQTITPVAGRRWYIAIAADNATCAFRGLPAAGHATFVTKATSFALPASITTATFGGNFGIPAVAIGV